MIISNHISGRKALFCRLTCKILITLLIISALVSSLNGEERAPGYPDTLQAVLEERDSLSVTLQPDSVPEQDSSDLLSLIERGRAYLKSGNLDSAQACFTRALLSKSARVKCQARIGLGDVLRKKPTKNWNAVAQYRLALRQDPSCREAYYSIAQTGFDLKWTEGYRTAARALARLICLDPEYLDAYAIWREKIFDQSADELRQVAGCLENYLIKNPDKSWMWLDIAYIRYRLFAVESCLKALEQLEQNVPDYKRTEQFLLRARCLLELGDTLGFEQNYKNALDSAEKEGDFTRLILDSEPIFRPEETKKAARLKTPAEFADFFRTFWKRRDPDPISLRNERLVEHYVRLREAEKIYHMKNPHSFFQTSHNYYRLLSPFSALLKYDPDIFWDRSRSLALDPRGLLFVRHGPPDEIRLPEPPMYGPPPSIEVWRYGPAFFPFEARFGTGDYVFIPVYVRGIGNVKKAMETDTYKDPLPQFKQDFYGADFMAQNGKTEMEFYQSAPASKASLTETPGVSLAVFDLSWKEIARDSSRTVKIFTGRDSLWIGVNSVQLEPGNCIYAVRMDIPGRRAVQRNTSHLYPYNGTGLELSGVILGSPPEPGVRVHRRGGVDILPRPSLKFLKDEIITVYLEIYGLRQDRMGSRRYLERVTVIRTGKEPKGKPDLSDNIKRLAGYEKKSSGSLTLSFEREPTETTGSLAEHFTIDTSLLVPGSYRLKIEVFDRSTGEKKSTGCFFELKER